MKPLILLAAALCAAPLALHAQAVPKLQFTELSDTDLEATLDGNPYGTVKNVGPDHWEWRSGVTGTILEMNNIQSQLWAEPAGESGVNLLSGAFFDTVLRTDGLGEGNLGLEIISERTGFEQLPKNADGAYGFTYLGFAVPLGGGQGSTVLGPVDVYFSDKGDDRSVPEHSSTFALLLLSTVALFGISRSRTARAS